MSNFQKNYFRTIGWSTIEATLFQSMLLFHQYLLFAVTDHHFYGCVGTIFGGIYFLVKLCDGGLNKSLISFYTHYSKNRFLFCTFLKKQIVPTALLFCAGITTLFVAKLFFTHKATFLLPIDYCLLSIASGIIASETIKATLKRLLQLSHHFRQVTLCEIGFIVCYQIMVWSYYWNEYPLTLFFIFSSFLLVSLLEMIGLSFLVMRLYYQLPSDNHYEQVPKKLIIKNRLYAYAHSMGKQLFSANALVPLFAYSFGFECAALLKLASYTTHAITSIIEKILDSSSSTLFVHGDHTKTADAQERFIMASHVAHHLLIGLFIFIIINFSKLISFSPTTMMIAPYSALYFLIHYSENFFITIERFYIAHKRSEFLFLSTAITSIFMGIIFFYSLSPLSALALILFSRIISFFFLLLPLVYIWNIKPTLGISPRYFFGSLVISSLFFLFFTF
jgi:hypothetical protein